MAYKKVMWLCWAVGNASRLALTDTWLFKFYCRWLPRGKGEPRLQVASRANKVGALGKSKKRRRRKAKLWDTLPRPQPCKNRCCIKKNFVLASLMIDSFVAVVHLEKNLSKKYWFQVKMLWKRTIITYDDIYRPCFLNIHAVNMRSEERGEEVFHHCSFPL